MTFHNKPERLSLESFSGAMVFDRCYQDRQPIQIDGGLTDSTSSATCECWSTGMKVYI